MGGATTPTQLPDDPHEGLPKLGDIIAGKYVLDRVLGRGGMGAVVAAHHAVLGHDVAIKFLSEAALRDPGAQARFIREAQAAIRIRGEHVARVVDVGSLASGAPYMIMDLLSGTDLENKVECDGPLPVPDAVDYVLQAAEALAEAHAIGIVHRDLKPANLFLSERADGSAVVKVLDFGIAKAMAEAVPGASNALTMTGLSLGTPCYMSPEQVRNAKDADARTDIWGLGAVLYHLLAGEPPFTGETLPAVCAQVVADPTPLLRDKRADAPVGLEQVIVRCMEKERSARYPNLAELAEALAPFAPEHARVSVQRIVRIVADREPRASGSGDAPPAARSSADASTPSAHAADAVVDERPIAEALDSDLGPDRAPTVRQSPSTAPGPRDTADHGALRGQTVAQQPALAGAQAVAAVGLEEGASDVPQPLGRRRRQALVVGGLLLVAAAVLLAILGWPTRDTDTAADAASAAVTPSASVSTPPEQLLPATTAPASSSRTGEPSATAETAPGATTEPTSATAGGRPRSAKTASIASQAEPIASPPTTVTSSAQPPPGDTNAPMLRDRK